MSIEENKAIARRYYQEIWSQGHLDVADEIIGTTGEISPEGVKSNISAFRLGFPDAHFTVEDQIAEGDRVVTRLTMRGTHRGSFWEVDAPATGRAVTWTGMCIHHYAHGRLVKSSSENDFLGLLQQIGAIPMPEMSLS